jgi:hypothetical protein
MNPEPAKNKVKNPYADQRGFALVLTLSLISFVFLLVMGLISQVRMDLAHTEARENLILSKAHARMGMMIAIGELQKHLGPDMRVSTTADIYDERIESTQLFKTSSYPQSPTTENSLDLDEDGNANDTIPIGQRRWTGVWKTRGGNSESDERAFRPLPNNRDAGVGFPKSWDTDDAFDRHPAIELAWLVSGNEGWSRKLGIYDKNNIITEYIEVPDGVIIDDEGQRTLNKPNSRIYGKVENAWADHRFVVEGQLVDYFHPLVDINETGTDEETVETTYILRAPVMKVDGSYASEPVRVPVTKIASGSGKEVGNYAYWVGDEGVKSKFNINPPAGLSDTSSLMVAPAPNFSVSGAFDEGDGHDDLITLLSHAELSTSDEAREQELMDLMAMNFHQFTVDSYGVLSDVRTGGLKRDLSLAFAKDSTSKLWEKDFNDNFIFRDRVHCLKSLPIYNHQSQKAFGKGLHRNHWFDQAGGTARGPLVDDKNALLAGPRWSVLAEYHKLYEKYNEAEELEIEPADEFPRVVGDNALIFDRRGIEGNQGMTISQARPFFNIFGGPIRSERPEPKNYPIFPLITKVGVSVFPAVGTSKLALAISPKVSLWNPYDMPIKLEGLYLDIPFRKATFNATNFNLKEYDLYRKWWIRLYNNVESFPTRGNAKGISDRSKLKKPDSPWGLFRRAVDQERLTVDGAARLFQYMQPGIIDASKMSYNVDGNPQSLQMRSLNNGTKVLDHENPRENVTYTGEFHFFSFADKFKVNVNLPRIYVSLQDDVLDPGEVATFTIEELQTEDIPGDPKSNPPLIRLRKGDLEDFFLWESSFAYSNEKLQSDYIVSYYLDFTGINGLGSNSLEQITKTKNGFTYSQLGSGYIEYDSLALYQDTGSNPANFDPTNAEPLIRFNLHQGRSETLDDRAIKSYANIHTTEQYLLDNYANAFDHTNDLLPGTGWEWSAAMPADEGNERIILNEFNPRALVHSTQHGRGQWLKNWQEFGPGFLSEMNGLSRNFSFDGVEQYSRTDEDGNILTFDLSDDTVLNGYTYPSFMTNRPTNIEFPWLYDFDGGWSPDDYDFNTERSFNSFPASVGSYNPDDRAELLGLSSTGENPAEIVENDNANAFLLTATIPRTVNSKEKIGFFNHESKRSQKMDRNEIGSDLTSSSHAILFEIPRQMPLSILQYRHASLNNYLHGPAYALGNSYASTQVARHRPWGRLDSRETKVVKDDPSVPEAETWTASVKTPADMVKLQNEHHDAMWAKYGQNYLVLMPSNRIVDHWDGQGLDFSDRDSRFAPWRGHASNSNNHQNTTLDHSFYLNRALLDGYFLSGSTDPTDFNDETNNSLGDRFRPFYFESEGNHRLHAYMRKTGTWADERSSFGSQSSEKANSTTDDEEYRYQSIAGDLLVEGSFNINSTSVDAWVAQLASLRGVPVPNANIGSNNQTPVPRFLKEPDSNNWNDLRMLTDQEIVTLAKQMVRQVKLRGPFLSFSDFVNRRLNPSPMDPDPSVTRGSRPIFLQKKMSEWASYPEDRHSVLGLRGAVQAAIANAGLNDDEAKGWVTNNSIPQWPSQRWVSQASPGPNNVGSYQYAKFGFHAVSSNKINYQYWDYLRNETQSVLQAFGSGMVYQGDKVVQVLDSPTFGTAKLFDSTIKYSSSVFGEAPENLLAVEHVATGANKPGWVMQSDLLSPLAPVTSARSDTFTIRVMGESDAQFTTKSWIELVVQRTPDYVKSDLDAPHHRPHEPFKDLNLNGYWDDDDNLKEQWIDLNRNGDVVINPDLPGVGESGRERDYRDGMISDLKLNLDPHEEDDSEPGRISLKGINQRFGRKFKIVRFRWLREQDV